MIFADVMVRFSTIDVMVHDKLPCGAAGLKVRFRFMDSAWNDLKKIAVFRNKTQTFDVAIVDNCATIPQELLTKVLDVIDVGIYGTDAEQALAIPTLWGSLGRIESAANPSGDPVKESTTTNNPAPIIPSSPADVTISSGTSTGPAAQATNGAAPGM